jgi:arylsulfatase A-like enzyme
VGDGHAVPVDKQITSHFGGTRNPAVVSWAAKIAGSPKSSSWFPTGACIRTAGWRLRWPIRPGSLRKGYDPNKAKRELYNIDNDFSQANDLATENPDTLRALVSVE